MIFQSTLWRTAFSSRHVQRKLGSKADQFSHCGWIYNSLYRSMSGESQILGCVATFLQVSNPLHKKCHSSVPHRDRRCRSFEVFLFAEIVGSHLPLPLPYAAPAEQPGLVRLEALSRWDIHRFQPCFCPSNFQCRMESLILPTKGRW